MESWLTTVVMIPFFHYPPPVPLLLMRGHRFWQLNCPWPGYGKTDAVDTALCRYRHVSPRFPVFKETDSIAPPFTNAGGLQLFAVKINMIMNLQKLFNGKLLITYFPGLCTAGVIIRRPSATLPTAVEQGV